VSNPSIPLFDLVMEEEDLAAVRRVLEAGRLSAGPEVEAFEHRFAEHLGCSFTVAVSNCTAALHLAYAAVGVGPGDEVIVPSITFAATAAAAIYNGATPVFADVVGPTDLGIDPDDVELKITSRTKAICAVHFAGYPAAVDRLAQIASEHGVALIEDVAHAPLADLDGKALGTFGAAGCFSFFSNKVLAVGEGGLICTDDPEVYVRVKALRDEFAYAFDEPRAALVSSRMTRLEQDVRARRELTKRYREILIGAEGIVVPYSDESVDHSSCYVMPLVLEDVGRQSAVRAHMREHHGVQTSLLYPAIHEFTAYVERFGEQSVPKSERIARTEVTVPLFPHMTHAQQDRVVAALREALEVTG
jgi:dTDP-4-amino-4,6-dideoxygalactose transaminase